MDMSESPCLHDPLSPAIQRCCDARNRIFIETAKSLRANPAPDNPAMNAEKFSELLAKAGQSYATRKAAAASYRYAMPDPSTRQGIKDYIACVLHGMTIEAVNQRDGAALLAGARIALASYRGRRSKSAEKANRPGNPQTQPQPPLESAA
jgi:hypothetical protein